MNDREFDNHFRKELEEEIKHPFDDKLWDNLSQRLEEHEKGNPILGGTTLPQVGSEFRNLYWLTPLFLLLLGTNAWFMWNANKTQGDNEKLMGELKSLKTILEKKDTVVKIQVIHKTDTIYIDRKTPSFEKKISSAIKSRFLDSESTPQPNGQAGSVFKGLEASSNSIFYNEKGINSALEVNKKTLSGTSLLKENPKTDLPFSAQKLTESIDNQLIKNNENLNNTIPKNALALENKGSVKTDENSSVEQFNTSATDKLPLLMPSIITVPMPQTQNVLMALNATPIQKSVPFKRLYFGLTGSWLNYQTAWVNAAGLEVFRNEKSYQVGLRLEYAFNEHWRLMFGTDYCPFNFDISWKDDRYNLPDIPEEYVRSHKMKSVQANERLLNGFLGAKYIFNGLRAKPYIGLAYSAMKITPYVANYRLQNLWTQAETDVAVQHSGETISNLMMLTGGYEFKMGGRFVAQTEAFMYKDLNKEKKMFDLFGVRATILARF